MEGEGNFTFCSVNLKAKTRKYANSKNQGESVSLFAVKAVKETMFSRSQLWKTLVVHVYVYPYLLILFTANEFPCLPKQVAWILATRRVFMYPELLPICSLKANPPRDKIIFTKAEDK